MAGRWRDPQDQRALRRPAKEAAPVAGLKRSGLLRYLSPYNVAKLPLESKVFLKDLQAQGQIVHGFFQVTLKRALYAPRLESDNHIVARLCDEVQHDTSGSARHTLSGPECCKVQRGDGVDLQL